MSFFFSKQSDPMRKFLDSLAPGREQSMQERRCAICDGPAVEFKDEISRREFEISGLCQECQDVAFAPEPVECVDCQKELTEQEIKAWEDSLEDPRCDACYAKWVGEPV